MICFARVAGWVSYSATGKRKSSLLLLVSFILLVSYSYSSLLLLVSGSPLFHRQRFPASHRQLIALLLSSVMGSGFPLIIVSGRPLTAVNGSRLFHSQRFPVSHRELIALPLCHRHRSTACRPHRLWSAVSRLSSSAVNRLQPSTVYRSFIVSGLPLPIVNSSLYRSVIVSGLPLVVPIGEVLIVSGLPLVRHMMPQH